MMTRSGKTSLDELLLAAKSVYHAYGFDFADLKAERESAEYGACTFTLNGMAVIHRVAKITPIKTGQFVTIWKRNEKGITEPFNISDNFNIIIITVKNNDHFGQFIFPKSALLARGIITGKTKAGKRGMRVYPPWDLVANTTAAKTQKWQLEYFIDLSDEKRINLNLVTKLFNKVD
jgi:hypothetical protein